MKLGVYTAGCILFAQMGAVHGLKLSDFIDGKLAGTHSLAQSQSSDLASLVADTHKKENDKAPFKVNSSNSVEPSTEDKLATDIAQTIEDTFIGMQCLVEECKKEADLEAKNVELKKTVEAMAANDMSSGKKETSSAD